MKENLKINLLNLNDLILSKLIYKSSSGTEYFISYTNKDGTILYGFIRLRLNIDLSDVMTCLHNHALIRELHVYGNHVNIGSNMTSTSVQHKGLGSKLLKEAELTAYINGYRKIAVIPGSGVRNYYKKRGYYLGKNNYMYKNLLFTILLNNNYSLYIIMIFTISLSLLLVYLYYYLY